LVVVEGHMIGSSNCTRCSWPRLRCVRPALAHVGQPATAA
jgi:hypothetical protein